MSLVTFEAQATRQNSSSRFSAAIGGSTGQCWQRIDWGRASEKSRATGTKNRRHSVGRKSRKSQGADEKLGPSLRPLRFRFRKANRTKGDVLSLAPKDVETGVNTLGPERKQHRDVAWIASCVAWIVMKVPYANFICNYIQLKSLFEIQIFDKCEQNVMPSFWKKHVINRLWILIGFNSKTLHQMLKMKGTVYFTI